MLLNDQCTAQSPMTQIYPAPTANSTKVGNSCLNPIFGTHNQPMCGVDMALFLRLLFGPFFLTSLCLISLLGTLTPLELEIDFFF